MTPYQPPSTPGADDRDRQAAAPVEVRISDDVTLVLDGRVIEILDATGPASGRWHVDHVAIALGEERAEGDRLLEIVAPGGRRMSLRLPAARASAALAFAEAVRRVRARTRRLGG